MKGQQGQNWKLITFSAAQPLTADLLYTALSASPERMLGMSYGELLLLIGATAALIGPKDLPKIAKAAGMLTGRAVGYVQIARGQFDGILQQSQVNQVHKELQDAISQLEAIRYEMRSLSFMSTGPMTRTLMDNEKSASSDTSTDQLQREDKHADPDLKNHYAQPGSLTRLQCQSVICEKFSNIATTRSGKDEEKHCSDVGVLDVLPISAESVGLLPKCKDEMKGSDIMLEAVLEAEIAANAKCYIENQILSR